MSPLIVIELKRKKFYDNYTLGTRIYNYVKLSLIIQYRPVHFELSLIERVSLLLLIVYTNYTVSRE